MNHSIIRILKNPKYQKFLIFTCILSLIISFLIFKKVDHSLLTNDLNNLSLLLKNNHLNYFILHFLIITFLSLTSLIGLGIITIPLYLIFEEICIFYNIFSFISIYHLKGFIFSCFFNLLTKGIYLLLLFFILLKIVALTKIFLNNLSKSSKIKYPYSLTFKKIIFLILLIFLYDLFLYFFGSLILSKLIFILN